MLARKLGPALAAGCTVVVKPATATPYSGLAWGKLCQDVGFPDGVVNIVTGSARATEGRAYTLSVPPSASPLGHIAVGGPNGRVRAVALPLAEWQDDS